ncbi:MAG TPA: sugar phosphate isomerase/epimerase family protein [Opitutus sp.]|nr:sugar phosphate isomerase/epimerase family protein [Opitutus sp.]
MASQIRHDNFALSEFTTGEHSLADDVRLCNELGIAGIEVCESKLPENEREARDLLMEVRDAGLHLVSVQARVHALFPDGMAPEPADPQARMDAMRRTMELFATALPDEHPSYVLIGGRAPDHDFSRARETLLANGGRLADEAQAHGGRIAFEPLHRVMMNENTFLSSWEEAVRIANIVAHDSFKLVCDIWNVWDQTDIIERVRNEIAHVAVVHASDWHKGGPRRLNDRMVPGRGIISWETWGAMLGDADYRGWVCLEMLSEKTFHDSYLHEEPAKYVDEAREHLRRAGCLAHREETAAAK